MRPVVALGMAAMILLTVHFYIRSNEPSKPAVAGDVPLSPDNAKPSISPRPTHDVRLEVTLGCDIVPGADFTLHQKSLRVQLRDVAVCEIDQPMEAGSIVVQPVAALRPGSNRFYVEAIPAKSMLIYPVRIRLLLGEEVLGEQTIWSERPGDMVRGAAVFSIPESVFSRLGEAR